MKNEGGQKILRHKSYFITRPSIQSQQVIKIIFTSISRKKFLSLF